MEIMILKHYSYKIMLRVEVNLKDSSIEDAKKYVKMFEEKDKQDCYLTFVEYYIYFNDEEGYQHRYFKEKDYGYNVKKTLKNIPYIVKTLRKFIDKREHQKIFKYYLSVKE